VIAAVLLAAGSSSRLGKPKQLVVHEGRSLLRRAAEAACASSCAPVIVVLGAAGGRDQLAGLDVVVVENTRSAEGVGTSIAAGIGAARACEAAVIMLCDQIAIGAQDLDALCEAHRRARKAIVAAAYEGVRGPPALFARALFDELAALAGDFGARRIIARHEPDVLELPMPHAALDVDTPEDVRRFTRR
jgi:molybdenum cofactor cytidylyltransferase